MKEILDKKLSRLLLLSFFSLVIRFFLVQFLDEKYNYWLKIFISIFIIFLGVVFVLKKAADVIEETTETLSERTKLASGLLQSLGTAFPDMALGVVAAMISLRLRSTDLPLAINYALIAASTTFGSNIFNVAQATWCIYRQNLANFKDTTVLMVPKIKSLGQLKPINQHKNKLNPSELQISLDAIAALTILTTIVAITMVLFGKVNDPLLTVNGDIYQLIRPVGLVILVACMFVLFFFRHSQHQTSNVDEIEKGTKYYELHSNLYILFHIFVAGVAILLAAEAMIKAIEIFCHLTGVPVVLAGALSGLIGCLGEMIVVHDFSVHPNGRLGDAIMGVAMDNIVTTFGASIVAVMGGIFLGGSSLIMIFVVILSLNTILMWQISKLQPYITVIK